MTKERGEELANMFKDNYELAKKMGADNAKLALIVALLYTLDDMNQERVETISSIFSEN